MKEELVWIVYLGLNTIIPVIGINFSTAQAPKFRTIFSENCKWTQTKIHI